MKKGKITLVIPVYNEITTLQNILERIDSSDFCGLEKEIILVDDFSRDGSRGLLKELEKTNRYKIYYHTKNLGKGAALRTGFKHASGDIIAIQDADLEYDPNDYKELINLILEDKADVVYGSRLFNKKHSKSFKLSQLIGNKFLTFATNILYNTTLTDMETCYKAFKVEVIKNIQIKSDKFDFEPEITAKVLKKGYRLLEVPISYYGRDYTEGKKITWKDGIAALITLIKYRFVD